MTSDAGRTGGGPRQLDEESARVRCGWLSRLTAAMRGRGGGVKEVLGGRRGEGPFGSSRGNGGRPPPPPQVRRTCFAGAALLAGAPRDARLIRAAGGLVFLNHFAGGEKRNAKVDQRELVCDPARPD
ncbi:uncharacterized protein A4U43_C01F36200 [Asparagus officinalis]|uniref:Uncharacterized protein n=1 Tax=Asparagus officinalis TaxID=4686 RepID=A0A5P1FV29_ASPOF|nr:uncharacterized protein A4U43_C01F36200 [Asparagus officinalis]